MLTTLVPIPKNSSGTRILDGESVRGAGQGASGVNELPRRTVSTQEEIWSCS